MIDSTQRPQSYGRTIYNRQVGALQAKSSQIESEAKRIDFFQRMVGAYRATGMDELRRSAQSAVDALLNELKEINLSSEEGRFGAISIQAEIRSLEWFTKGGDRLSIELRERVAVKARLEGEVKEIQNQLGLKTE